MSDNDLIEIRVLWQRTDYGYLSVAAARGFGGRELGSYQDSITNEQFQAVRDQEREVHPDWPLAESVVKVRSEDIEALFTVPEIESQ